MTLKTRHLGFIAITFTALTFTSCSKDEDQVIKEIDPCKNIEANNSIISNFECQQNFFLGGDPQKETTAPAIDNTYKSEANNSEKIGKYVDNGTQAWDNLPIDFSSAYDLTDRSLLKIKVYTEHTGILIAKLEGGTQVVEKQVNMEKTNEWVEYSFNFREAIDMGNTKLILFFNAGAEDGAEQEIYYIDDIQFVENNTPIEVDPCEGIEKDMNIISDFDCQKNYELTGQIAVISNPSKDDNNGSENVGEFTDNGTQGWDNLLVDYGKALDLSTKNKLKLMIRSDKKVQFLVKLEGGTSDANEVWMDITTTREWTEYTVDFSSQAEANHQKLVIFFNAGKEDGAEQEKYYLDNIRWE